MTYEVLKSKIFPKKNLIILSAVILIAIYTLVFYKKYESTDNSFLEGNISPISSKISGYVKKVLVSDNQDLKKGDVIFELDATDYELAVEKAYASLEAISAQYKSAQKTFEGLKISIPSNYISAKAQYDSAQANLEKAQSDLDRIKGLNDLTRTKKDLDYAIAAFKTASSQLEDAKAKMKSANIVDSAISAQEAALEQLEAQKKQSELVLQQALNDLDSTKIKAPFDGYVTKKSVEVGAYIQPGQTALSLIGKEFWVVANFKETQLKNIKIGSPVKVYLDAIPNVVLDGAIDSIQFGTGGRLSLFPTENATGNFVKVVQRVPVKISLQAQQYKNLSLSVGMSAFPEVAIQ